MTGADVFSLVLALVYKPPIYLRVSVAFLALALCVCLGLRGWLHVFDRRRCRGALRLTAAALVGFGGLWLLLLSPASWGWLL
jgi:hypothetical protein